MKLSQKRLALLGDVTEVIESLSYSKDFEKIVFSDALTNFILKLQHGEVLQLILSPSSEKPNTQIRALFAPFTSHACSTRPTGAGSSHYDRGISAEWS